MTAPPDGLHSRTHADTTHTCTSTAVLSSHTWMMHRYVPGGRRQNDQDGRHGDDRPRVRVRCRVPGQRPHEPPHLHRVYARRRLPTQPGRDGVHHRHPVRGERRHQDGGHHSYRSGVRVRRRLLQCRRQGREPDQLRRFAAAVEEDAPRSMALCGTPFLSFGAQLWKEVCYNQAKFEPRRKDRCPQRSSDSHRSL